MVQVFYTVLQERSMPGATNPSLCEVERRSGKYHRIYLPYGRVDVSRNKAIKIFLSKSSDPQDKLVMLDCDQRHPPDTVERLVQYDLPIVAGVTFRRGEPYDPLVQEKVDGQIVVPVDWEENELRQVFTVSTGAIALRRDVF